MSLAFTALPRTAYQHAGGRPVTDPATSTQQAAVDYEIGIVGAGFGGVLAALDLKLSGRASFVIFERAERLGGVWRDNIYPGCACDMQSHVYCFAARPNPDWTSNYASQKEILAYLEDVARRESLDRYIRFGTEVRELRFEDDQGCWTILDQRGSRTRVRVLLLAAGRFGRPFIPAFPGLESFAGVAFHSSAWNPSLDITNKRVAIVGTGATAIQLVPSLAPLAFRLTVFQRTPGWVVPRHQRVISPLERKVFRRFPLVQRLVRQVMYWTREAAASAVLGNRIAGALLTRMARRNLVRSIACPDLRRRLTPDYEIGCKRILVSDDFYPALNRDNVELITGEIAGFAPKAIRMASGREIDVDVVIFATGFRVTDMEGMIRVVGQDGRVLGEQWAKHGMEAYLGMNVAGFPNMAMLIGPNAGPPSASAVHVMESQMRYILKYIDEIERQRPGTALDVRPERQRAYNDDLQQRLRGTAWYAGCKSWYLDRRGKNTTTYPGLTSGYRRRTARFERDDYAVRRPRGEDARPSSSMTGQPIPHGD
jgi:cation diffusion facilitator CzcD-associated flavoprotein CzcO